MFNGRKKNHRYWSIEWHCSEDFRFIRMVIMLLSVVFIFSQCSVLDPQRFDEKNIEANDKRKRALIKLGQRRQLNQFLYIFFASNKRQNL